MNQTDNMKDPIYKHDIENEPMTEERVRSIIRSMEPAHYGNRVIQTGLLKSQNFFTGSSGWQIDAQGNAEFNNGTFRGTFTIGGTVTTINNTSNIQTYINSINSAGGGTLYLQPGTYTLGSAGITMYSGVSLIGISPLNTILDFNSTSGEVIIRGANSYTTGTITSITSGVAVVGSGTSWVANVTPFVSQFFIQGQWMLVAAVTDNTHLTLAEGYDGPTIGAGSSYRIATPMQAVSLSNLSIKNSTAAGLDIDDARFLTFNNLITQTNNVGMDSNYLTECSINELVALSNTSHGITTTNGGRFRWQSVNSVVNGGSGVVYNSVRSALFTTGVGSSNTADGFNITSCRDVSLTDFDANANGSQGVEAVSGNNNLFLSDAGVSGNVSDGIKLTASTNTGQIIGANIVGNGGWGINIANANCNTNILVGVITASNTSGGLTDSGTGTLKSATVNSLL